jgi:hypothetical protein
MTLNFKKSVDIGGRAINLLECITSVKTRRWLLMYLGTGELGPIDGSQILDLDNYGYQKYPTFETDFNIFVPQAVKGYSESDALIQAYMKRTYGQDIEIVMCGHSLGARNIMEFSYGYNGIKADPCVVGFMPVAGEMSYPLPTDWCVVPDVPIIAFHGEKDTAIGYVQSEKYVNGVNQCTARKNKAVLRVMPGLTHTGLTGIMEYVFKPDKTAEGYQFIMSCFSPETLEIPGKVILRAGNVFAKFDDGTERQISTV